MAFATHALLANFEIDSTPIHDADLNASLIVASGQGIAVVVTCQPGAWVRNLTWISGATALVTPTNIWTALYSKAGVLQAQSTDLGVGAVFTTISAKTMPLQNPVLVSDDSFIAVFYQNAVTCCSLLATAGTAVTNGIMATQFGAPFTTFIAFSSYFSATAPTTIVPASASGGQMPVVVATP